MNSFSINRFGRTLRWLQNTNFRMMLAWFVGMVLLVFMGEMIAYSLMKGLDPDCMIRRIADFGTAVMYISSLAMISCFVLSIRDKRKRVGFLMLPSSNLEKYLSLVIYASVIWICCIFLAMVVGDSLRMAWFWVRDIYGYTYEGLSRAVMINGELVYWYSSALPRLLDNLNPFPTYSSEYYSIDTLFLVMKYVIVSSFLLWMHSLYTLGGTLLRKYAFVTTSLLFILCLVLFIKSMHYFELNMFQIHHEQGHAFSGEIGTVAYVLAVLLPLLSAFNYWASYRIFKGFQLITNKWLNYDFYK